ncbi:MAG: hypothetical protein ACOCWQ_00500 [Nanoarchaeota archaeon]
MATPTQTIIIAITTGILFSALLLICRKFRLNPAFSLPLALALFIYSSGFLLRLSSDTDLIDTGFFLTGISTVYLSILFALMLFLGQIRYWKMLHT